MKMIEAWLVVTIWLALHNSINDRAADMEKAVMRKENAVTAVSLETKSEIKGGTESGERNITDTECETEGGTETETETEGEREDITEPGTEYGSEAVTETETEEESEDITETESEMESESEEKTIRITNLCAAYEKETRMYDGTTYVALEAEAEGMPEGVELSVWGEAENAIVGQWEVMPFFALTGEDAQYYEVHVEAQNPAVTIVPRPLTIKISDAQKYYYTENNLKSLKFLAEGGLPLEVTGFVEEEKPAGFCPPELVIDENILEKESPIYEDGEQKEYENAIIVKLDEEGKPTGNPTENYCFMLDEEAGYYYRGSVFLEPPPVVGTLDYVLDPHIPGTMYRDALGTLWVKKGSAIVVRPQEVSGFTEEIMTAPLYESGTVGFVLQKRTETGEVLAKSKVHQFSFCVDAAGPEGIFLVNGERGDPGECYSSENVTVSLGGVSDGQSGLYSAKLYVDREGRGQEEDISGIYQKFTEKWEEKRELTLAEEGNYRIYARLEDYVGNVTYLVSPQIYIDRTSPELQIQGIVSGSANNGRVSPEVLCRDMNYEEGSLRVILEGSKTGEKEFAQEREKKPDGEAVRICDIPREKRWDDLYVLRASARDMAGNYSEKKIVFSVNRFGSVFMVENQVKKKLESYYLQEPVDLIVKEFNVDTVLQSKVYLGCAEQFYILEEGKDYYVTQSRRKGRWQEYRYFIPAVNFSQEGVYYVVIATKDRAGNITDNRLQMQKIEFVVDRTKPSIIITGIKNGDIFEQSRVVEIECRDNILLEQTEIYLDDILKVRNCEENQQFMIPRTHQWQKLVVRATDYAGNVSVSDEIWAYLGNDGQNTGKTPAVIQRKKEEAKKIGGRKENQDKEAKQRMAAHDGKSLNTKQVGYKTLILPGMVFFSLLGVYFYKNKRVK